MMTPDSLDTPQKLALLGLYAFAAYGVIMLVKRRRRAARLSREAGIPLYTAGSEPLRDSVLFGTLGLVVVAATGAIFFLAQREQGQWEAFSAQHKCQVVGEMSGSVMPTTGLAVGANGKVGIVSGTAIESAKTGYKCDDGVTYWR